MTQLRQMVLDELQRRNYAEITIKNYLRIIDDFARYCGQPIEKLGPNHIRAYQAHLFRDRKLASKTVRQHVAALRFVYVKNAEARVHVGVHPISKGRATVAARSEPGGRHAAHRSVQFAYASRHADDLVCSRPKANGGGEFKGR